MKDHKTEYLPSSSKCIMDTTMLLFKFIALVELLLAYLYI